MAPGDQREARIVFLPVLPQIIRQRLFHRYVYRLAISITDFIFSQNVRYGCSPMMEYPSQDHSAARNQEDGLSLFVAAVKQHGQRYISLYCFYQCFHILPTIPHRFSQNYAAVRDRTASVPLSGWNCTPYTGNCRWLIACIVPSEHARRLPDNPGIRPHTRSANDTASPHIPMEVPETAPLLLCLIFCHLAMHRTGPFSTLAQIRVR